MVYSKAAAAKETSRPSRAAAGCCTQLTDWTRFGLACCQVIQLLHCGLLTTHIYMSLKDIEDNNML